MISILAGWITAFISVTGYMGVMLLMALESACLPLPSEVIMPFAGYLAGSGKLNLYFAATAGAVGCNLGSWPAYELARSGGREAVQRYGKWVLVTGKDLSRANRFFARFGNAAIFIGRLLPGVRSFVAIPAGVAKMPRKSFHLLTFLGSWPWCFVLAWIGKSLGERWRTDPHFSALFNRLQLGVGLVFLLLILIFVGRRAMSSIRARAKLVSARRDRSGGT